MTAEQVVERVAHRLFGKPILRNSVRGEVAEEIVAMALEPDCELCSHDWAGFDLLHREKRIRLEVKQSAAWQSWHANAVPESRPRFSIATKTGRWDGPNWINEPGRQAHLYVFAWHPRVDADADHRNPHQWEFFVVQAARLPYAKSISLAGLESLASRCCFEQLRQVVNDAIDLIEAR